MLCCLGKIAFDGFVTSCDDQNWLFLVMNVKDLLFYIKYFYYKFVISSKKSTKI